MTLPNFDATYAPPLDILSLEPLVTGLVEEEVVNKVITFSALEIFACENYTLSVCQLKRRFDSHEF